MIVYITGVFMHKFTHVPTSTGTVAHVLLAVRQYRGSVARSLTAFFEARTGHH
jgi:hypothetical protein